MLNKNINVNKDETESKMENGTHSFTETKVKLWWGHFRTYRLFYTNEFFLSFVFYLKVLKYWIHFQIIHTFTYRKRLLHTLFSLFLKSSKAFSVSLKNQNFESFLKIAVTLIVFKIVVCHGLFILNFGRDTIRSIGEYRAKMMGLV